MRALALSGGGARIHYQVGAVCWLLGKNKTEYDLFCGVGAGALVAACLAQYREGKADQASALLEHATSRLKRKDVLGSWSPLGVLHGLFGRSSFYSSKPLRRFVQALIDPALIRSSGKFLCVGAVRVDTGRPIVFTENYDDLCGAVIASNALPGIFEPVGMWGQLMISGGACALTPIGVAIESGAAHIDVVMTSPAYPEHEERAKPSALEALVRNAELAADELLQKDLQMSRLNNELAFTKIRADKRLVTMNVIRPTKALPIGVLDFDSANVEVTRSLGYRDARLAVPGMGSYRSSLI